MFLCSNVPVDQRVSFSSEFREFCQVADSTIGVRSKFNYN